MTDELEIVLPERANETDPLEFGLLALTEAISKIDEAAVAHGVLGGEFGYGAKWENEVFEMRPFYWGDCDCRADERSEVWHKANPHADDCFQTELHRRFAEYDEQSGWNALEAAGRDPGMMEARTEKTPFGTIHMTLRTEAGEQHHRLWSAAYDKKNKTHAKLTSQLYDEYKLPRSRYQWHCTCGVDERAAEYFKTESHYAECAIELPNFRHKSSNLEVRWYKWIGRDMKVNQKFGPKKLRAIFAECAASLEKCPMVRERADNHQWPMVREET